MLSDNAQSFGVRAVAEFADRMGFEWKFLSFYSAQANGRVERFIGTLKRSLARAVWDTEREWDELLGNALYLLTSRSSSCQVVRSMSHARCDDLWYHWLPQGSQWDPIRTLRHPMRSHSRGA